MTLETFASKYRLKAKRSPDDDNELVVNGKQGQIYEYSDTELAVSFTPGLDKDRRGRGRWTPKTWNNIRRKAEYLGMTVRQNGDSEDALSFDPAKKEHAKLAFRIARARQKRQMSPEAKAKLVSVGFKARQPTLEGQLGQ